MLTEYEARREARIAPSAILLELVGSLPAREMLARAPRGPHEARREERKAPSVPGRGGAGPGASRTPRAHYTTFERDEDLGDRVARRGGRPGPPRSARR